MTKNVKLTAQIRNEENDKVKIIRKNGFIPAVVYGNNLANKNIKIKKIDFEHAFRLAGEFNLIDLEIDREEPVKVIIKDVQKDVIKNNIIHVDFYRVDMTKKITTQIPLNFIGESKAVKELGGTLIKDMDNVEVRCLPSDLVSHIDVNLSRLENFGDLIRLNDLNLPEGIELVSETNEVVVGVRETKVEEEVVKPVEEVAGVAEAAPAEAGDKTEKESTEQIKPEGKDK